MLVWLTMPAWRIVGQMTSTDVLFEYGGQKILIDDVNLVIINEKVRYSVDF